MGSNVIPLDWIAFGGSMRGSDERSGSLFSYVDLEARVRRDHPLRAIREIANAALGDMTGDFAGLYTNFGRPSIAPEKLLRAMLLQVFYGVRSERQLMERMEFDLLFRWFVGLGVDDPVWDHSSFSKNRDRLLEGQVAAKFLTAVLAQPKVKRLLSSDHFSVDGTLLEAWASIKSFRRRDGDDNDREGPGRNAERSFHKEKRSNETHESTTDPEARLYKKGDGQPAKLCYMGHALMENRHGLAVDGVVSQATGTAERDEALAMIDRHRRRRRRRITLGADKAYDVAAFVQALKARSVTPHIAIDGHLSKTGTPRSTAIDRRTTRHAGYSISGRCRKRIEEVFGWVKGSAGLAKVKLRGRRRVDALFTLALAAYNLIRLPKLLAGRA
jgi:transposase